MERAHQRLRKQNKMRKIQMVRLRWIVNARIYNAMACNKAYGVTETLNFSFTESARRCAIIQKTI